MPVTLNEQALVRRRGMIPRLLHPLRPERGIACDFDASLANKARILAAHDGVALRGASYRNWFFRTSSKVVRAQYFEVWQEVNRGRDFQLVQAYLHLFRQGNAAEEPYEVLALHSDPSDENAHKRCPHIHVTRAEQPLPHCHFPLHLGRDREVTASIEALHAALDGALELIAREVLGAYAAEKAIA